MQYPDRRQVIEVDAKTIYICVKVINASYYPKQALGESVEQLGQYARCHGDGIVLSIDANTGQILNWKVPTVKEIRLPSILSILNDFPEKDESD